MIIDSPIISGSAAASGSLNQLGNITITGSLTVTGAIIGALTGSVNSASYAANAELLDGLDSTVFTLTSSFAAQTASFTAFTASINAQTASLNAFSASVLSYTSSINAKTSSFATTGSNAFIGTQTITGSILQSGSFTSTGTLTAQTLVVQTITSSVVYSSGSNIFGNDLANTQVLTGSVSVTGSLAVNGSNVVLTNQTSSMSASYALNATSASYAVNATTASYANTSTSASYSNNSTSASYAANAELLDGLDSTVFTLTSSFAAQTASFTAFTSSILAQTASLLSFTASTILTDATQSARLSGLEAASASINSYTSSIDAKIVSIYSTTSSLNASVASLNSYTQSNDANIASIYTTTASLNSFSASVLSYTASQNITNGTFTTTASFNAQTASFTAFTSSINAFSASILAQTASLNSFSSSVLTFTGSAATRLGALEAATASLYTATSSFNASVASLNSYTQSNDAKIASIYSTTSSLNTRVGTLEAYTSSLNNKTSSFATTGSNAFIGTQTITGSLLQSGSFTSTGTITAQTLVVQTITSSVIYSSGSNIFGNAIGNTQIFTGSLSVTGSTASFSGNVGIGTSSPSSLLHVSRNGNTAGGTILMGVANDSTGKWSYLTSTQYNSSTHTQGFSLIGAYTDATSNQVVIGGSIYEANPSTEIQFWTHTAVSHSTGGTRKMTIVSNGNVGIGSATPAYTLDVVGSIYASLALKSNYRLELPSMTIGYWDSTYNRFEGSSRPMLFTSYGSGNDINFGFDGGGGTLVLKQATGNVGIGTTAPEAKLDVRSQIQVKGDTNEQLILDFTAASGNYTYQSFRLNGVNKYRMFGYVDGDFALYSDTGSAYILYAKRDGNVGIGTTSPAYKLDVNGTGRFTSDLYGGVDIYTAAAIRFNGTGLNATDKKLYSPADGDLEWMTHNQAGVHGFAVSHQGTKAVYLNISGNSYFNGGNLGIGTTSPGAKLEVAGNGTGKILIGDIGGYTNYAGISLNGSTTAGYYNILSRASDGTLLLNRPFGDIAFYENNSTLHMIIKGTSGNVGIGTTAPLTPLHIYKAGDYQLRLQNPNTGGGYWNIGQSDNGFNAGGSKLLFIPNSSDSNAATVVFTTGGNVGIGTVSPTTTLQVAGTISPSANGTYDLGTSSLRWSTVYTSDLSLNNGIGDYTIVEGENDLFLYNNKQNKVYKFMLAEVDPTDATPKKS